MVCRLAESVDLRRPNGKRMLLLELSSWTTKQTINVFFIIFSKQGLVFFFIHPELTVRNSVLLYSRVVLWI